MAGGELHSRHRPSVARRGAAPVRRRRQDPRLLNTVAPSARREVPGYRPRTARSPSSMASTRARGSRPTRSTSHERSTSTNPSGTATESFPKPVTAASSKTLPARPARSRFEVRGTTWVCQTSTPRTSSRDTTTHGRRLSRSIQYTPPRATTAPIAPSARRLPRRPPRSVPRAPPEPHPPEADRRMTSPTGPRDVAADRLPTSRKAPGGCR